MSGSQSALYGGGSRWISNPKHLGIVSVAASFLNMKTDAASKVLSNNAGFFTNLALRGATASISVADTYVTVANITGSGFMCSLVSPTHSAAFTPTLLITVDGVAYTIEPSSTLAAQKRLMVGPYTIGQPTIEVGSTATINDVIQIPNNSNDTGFNGSLTGGVIVAPSHIALITPEIALSVGMPVLRFESSLKVEMKCSLLSGVAVDKQCGVSYRLDL